MPSSVSLFGLNGGETVTKKNQAHKILEYIEAHGSITAWEAMNVLGIMRLAARIADLKAEGIPIVTILKHKVNDDGSYTRWAEYRIWEAA